MFCQNCGNELPDEAAFCPSCGKKVQETSEKNVDVLEEEKEQKDVMAASSPEKWSQSYEKRKMIGTVVYKRIKTDVELSSSRLYIRKATGRKKYVEKNCNFGELLHVTQKKALDFWDGLYAVIAVVLAVIALMGAIVPAALVLLLIAAASVLTGYGNVVLLLFRDGSVFIVPMTRSQDAQDLIGALQAYCGKNIQIDASTFAAVKKKVLSEHHMAM